MEKRTLYKVFGIRLDILVNGKVRVDPLGPWDSRAMSLEGTSSVTQHQGPVGSGILVWMLSLGAGLLTGTLGKYWGREEENMFYRSHLSAVAWSVVLSKKLCDESREDLWKLKTFNWYFQKLNICIFLFCLFLPTGREVFPYCVPMENIQIVYFCLVAWFWLGFLY